MTAYEIPLWPEIPERLRISASQGILIPFIGAGVSQLAGCPGWEDFATAALRSFLRPGMLDHAQFDQLSRLSPRVKLSVAVDLERRHGSKINFQSILQPSSASAKATGDIVYRNLGHLARTFVTTNYDDWLDRPVAPIASLAGGPTEQVSSSKRNVLHDPVTFDGRALSNPDTVIHIHGSVQARDSMILTTSDYLGRYASHRVIGDGLEENHYLTFLDILFRTKSVLFIGYGLAELEVLEYIVEKARGISRQKATGQTPEEPQHYLLQGFYSHEIALMRSLRDYYLNECDIGLVPFSKDQKGWEQLVDVIEYVSSRIPVGELLASQRRLEMRELLE